MQALKLLVVSSAVVVVVLAIPEDENRREIFRECAKSNGFKRDPEKIKEMREAKKNDQKERPSDGVSNDFLCTQRCFQERIGFISDGKFKIEKVKDDKRMMNRIDADKADAFLKCLQYIEITECSDMKKYFACRKASMQ